MSPRARLIRASIADAQERLADAQDRGENETYLALCRYRIDELEAALAREEARAA